MHLKASMIKLQVLVTAGMRTDRAQAERLKFFAGASSIPEHVPDDLSMRVDRVQGSPFCDARRVDGLGPKARLMTIG